MTVPYSYSKMQGIQTCRVPKEIEHHVRHRNNMDAGFYLMKA